MKANTVVTIHEQVLACVDEKKSVSVVTGERYVKNVWRAFGLKDINSTALAETLDDLCKKGFLARYEQNVSKGGGEVAGVMRTPTTTRERIFTLTEAGKREYKRLLDERSDMSDLTESSSRA